MAEFKLHSEYSPMGDQPTAIEHLMKGLRDGTKEQTLLGATGTGKSVVKNTIVSIKRDGRIRQTEIDTIINDIFDRYPKAIQYSNDSEFINSKDIPQFETFQTLSVNPVTGRNAWKNVTQVSRHKVDTLIDVTTSDGRNVTSTYDHNFYVLRDGSLELTDGQGVKVGDFLPAPRSIDYFTSPLRELRVLDYIKDPSRFYVSLQKGIGLDDLSQLPVSRGKKWRIVNERERVAYESYADSVLAGAPQTAVAVGTSRRPGALPLTIPVTENLLKLLGYYIAEGHATARYVVMTSADREVINDVRSAIKELQLSLKKRLKPYDYQINSTILTRFLSDTMGHGAFVKKLPDFWTELSHEQLAQLLSAYYAGDGGVEKQGVYASTVSRRLASDLQYALLRFGIQSRVTKKYARLADARIRQSFMVSITGQDNLRLFKEKISFSLARKNRALDTLLSRKAVGNTNVDLIPLSGSVLREVRSQLGLYQRDIAHAIGTSRSLIGLIEQGERAPSFDVARRLIAFLKDSAANKGSVNVQNSVTQMASLLENVWTPIKTIVPIDRETTVYDFAVADNETFLAGNGGLFVHNTFAMANIIKQRGVPTLVLAHNKTLAAQLFSEFKAFFPENEVHYFVSYFDYYQPEAYIASSDTYIEKDSQINEEIDRLRHAATDALLQRRDVIIVASVSCIYGIGSPSAYSSLSLHVKKGERRLQDKMIRWLTDIQYQRNDIDHHRGTFRVTGDTVDIIPANGENSYRVEFFGDDVERITENNPLTGEKIRELDEVKVFPSSHYVTPKDKLAHAIEGIKEEFEHRTEYFERHNKLLEAQRLAQRTKYDIEMLEETGFVKGIENYSRYLSDREPGEQPATLLDYFPDDFLLFVDESHMTLPQVRGMYNGDRARKEVLVEHGFRMPSALDNRPLRFDEFDRHINQAIYVSATPAEYELSRSPEPAQQVIRPTGLLDPVIDVRPSEGQIDDLIGEIRDRTAKGERVLVTTLTKRMAEDLTTHLQELAIKTAYIHSEIDTLERGDILRDLRLGTYDVLVGINLLREGLDLPEVSLVAIIDADKEGFLRSGSALVQIIGRAARHLQGTVIMYADTVTKSMDYAISETNRRREIQQKYNEDHNITPRSIAKKIDEGLRAIIPQKDDDKPKLDLKKIPKDEYESLAKELTSQMKLASANLEFERAAELRDVINDIKARMVTKAKL